MLFVAFYVAERPHTTMGRFKIEMANELLMMILNYHFICFSDMVIDQYGKFLMGFSFIFFIGVLVFANVFNLAIEQFKEWRVNKLYRHQQQMIKERKEHFENLIAKFNENRKEVLETRPKKKKKQVKKKATRRKKIGLNLNENEKSDPITDDQVPNASSAPKFQSSSKKRSTNKTLKRPK